ncbi:LOW QUALITY PROTEIN: hypothetical protein U9M48_031171 [Paspalum notatum var. saurae]|uniref:Uncharacterized protein n=1 Tax=Paspalum notatum var. saurae TaxID=547442 RepID=A0AAQ3U374_PASNO
MTDFFLISQQYCPLVNKDWKHTQDRFEKMLRGSKGKLLSVGGRLVLINSVLSIPRKVYKKLEYLRSRFYWQNDEHKKKYRLLKWATLCQPKDMGRLGIQNLDIQNKCLLSKWLFKLLNEDEQNLKPSNQEGRRLSLLDGVNGYKDQFLDLGTFKLNRLDFRKMFGIQFLEYLYLNLFNIVRKKHAMVAEVLRTNPLNVSFRRALVEDKLLKWRTWLQDLSMALSLLSLRICISSTLIIYRERIEVGIRLVVSAARLKPFTFESLSVSMPNSYGMLFIQLKWEGINTMYHYWQVQQFFASQFGSQGMRVFLAISNQNIFCRYFSRERTGFSFGPHCNALKNLRNS